MDYRVYLLDDIHHIRAAENFAAEDDDEAVGLASRLHDACSDVLPVCELWHGDTMLHRLTSPTTATSNGVGYLSAEERQLVAKRNRHLLDLEERLQRSFACVRESRRLLREWTI